MVNVVSNLLKEYKDINGNNLLLNDGSNSMSHNDLEIKSNQFAAFLQKSKGIKKFDRIVVMMDLSIDTIITFFGIIKTGAIFVPVDMKQPKENLNYIISTISPSIIIADKKMNYKGLDSIIYDKFDNTSSWNNYLEFDANDFKAVKIISKDIIYIMFTSGTTGKPKGVMVNNMSIMTYMNYVTSKFKHNKNTRSLCRTPISFDPFLTEVLPSIISGGQVYIQNRNVGLRQFLSYIEKNRISNFGCGPSLLYLLLDNINLLKKYDLSSLEEIYIGYEKCNYKLIESLRKIFVNTDFITGYGTTESFASSTFYKINGTETEIPLGEPIDNTEFYVVDEHNKEVDFGEVGQLIIRGQSLFHGYWNNDEETKKRLQINPFFPLGNEKVFYTGDLVRKAKDGNLYFIGRNDLQVKINGYRVELEEIKNILQEHKIVKECEVLFLDEKIVCIYNTYDGSLVNNEKLKADQFLSAYKIPKKWIYLKNFPRNKNSKIDLFKVNEYAIKYLKDNK